MAEAKRNLKGNQVARPYHHGVASSATFYPWRTFIHKFVAVADFHFIYGLLARAYFHPGVASHGILSSKGSKTTLHGPLGKTPRVLGWTLDT